MWIIFLFVGLAVVIFVALILTIVKYLRDYWKFVDIPHQKPQKWSSIFRTMCGRRDSPPLGNGDDGAEATEYDEQKQYDQTYNRFKGTGPFCGFYYLLEARVLVLDRELVKQILFKNFSNFNDRGRYYNCQKDPLSGDLFSLRDSDWREMRDKLEPIFSSDQMATIYPSLYAESDKLLQSCADALHTGEPHMVDIKRLTRRYVLSSIAACVFGLDDVMQRKYPIDEFETMTIEALTTSRHGDYMNTLLCRYPRLSRYLGLCTTAPKVEQYFMDLIADVVNERNRRQMLGGEPKQQDYMQLLINLMIREMATHAFETTTNPKQLKQHLMHELSAHAFVFLKAGFEPTAHTLSCVLYELARHENEQDRVRQEIHDVMSKHNDELSYECVLQLDFMGQVILETLRMHPITPYLRRRALNDYHVPDHPNYLIRKGMIVIIPTHAIHNDNAIYPEPYVFQPDRFSAEENQRRDQSVWMGFGLGPRNCIGMHFAQLQIRSALATLLLQYRFRLDNQRPVMRCMDGISLRVEPLPRQDGVEANTVI